MKRTLPMTFALRKRAMLGISDRNEKVVGQVLKQMLVNLRGDE